jgi:ectoine hydroxylase
MRAARLPGGPHAYSRLLLLVVHLQGHVFGCTFRWIAIRDDNDGIWSRDWAGRLSPVQRQLLGVLAGAGGDHAWGHDPATTPLYGWLKQRNLLDAANPPLKP